MKKITATNFVEESSPSFYSLMSEDQSFFKSVCSFLFLPLLLINQQLKTEIAALPA